MPRPGAGWHTWGHGCGGGRARSRLCVRRRLRQSARPDPRFAV